MPVRHKVNTTTGTPSGRLSSTERHQQRVAEIAGKQGDLKREAAERRAARALRNEPPTAAAPRKPRAR